MLGDEAAEYFLPIDFTPFQYSLIHFTQAVRFYVWEKSQNVQNDGLKNHSGMKYPLN